MNPNASPTLNSAADPPVAAAASGPATNRRFLYAGGTRPLDGYTIKRGVGQGGFGEIYYAMSDSGKEVALKLIRRNLEVELRGIRQCLNLKHPNLLHLFDIRQDDNGDTWVVMEYVAGLSLQDAVEAQPNGMPIEEASAWIHGISAAVAYLHDHGIVHRDLKPGNIFSDDGVVKVGDYGLSKFISCSRRSGHTESIGTVHYMAPEVANGRYGKEIDVYALGIVLYELLTGRVPFDGESVGEVLMKHLTAQVDVSMLPEPYRNIVAKAMEKDPEKRYRSANEFLAALPPPQAVLPGTGRLPEGSRGNNTKADNGEVSIDFIFPEKSGSDAKTAQATTVVGILAVDEEPILAAVRKAWRKIADDWNRANLNPTTKTLILVGAVVVLIVSIQLWLPLAIASLMFYGVYRLVRWIVLSSSKPGDANVEKILETRPELAKTVASPLPGAQAGDSAASPRSIRDRDRWRRPYEKSLPALVLRTPREQAADLLGAMLFSTLIAAALTIVMAFILAFIDERPVQHIFHTFTDPMGVERFDPSYSSTRIVREHATRPEHLAWLFFMTVAGSWIVLLPSKLWEGVKGETMPRRCLMMILGLGLGMVACDIANYFQVDFINFCWAPFENPIPANFYGMDGRPLLPAFLIVFGTLFFLIRWWRGADPLRSTRLSIFSVVFTVLAAGILGGFFHFPYPWLMLLAGAISISVQLSSPWLHPRERAAIRRG